MPTVRAGSLDQQATTAIGNKDWATARRHLDEAISIDPEQGFRYLTRGYVREMADDRAGAIADYGEAIRRDPKSTTALAMRCLAYNRASDYERAVADCDAALALDSTDASVWHGRAEIARSKGLDEEALQAARRFVEGAPNEAHAHLLLATVLIDTGELAAAENEIRAGAEIAPGGWEVAFARSRLFLRRGDPAAALQEAERAVSVDQKEAWTYVVRARVRRAQRDFEHALTDLERAIALDPN